MGTFLVCRIRIPLYLVAMSSSGMSTGEQWSRTSRSLAVKKSASSLGKKWSSFVASEDCPPVTREPSAAPGHCAGEQWSRAPGSLAGKEPDALLGKNDNDFFPKEEADFF